MKRLTLFFVILLMALTQSPLKADPCGMVPPIMVNNDEEQFLTRTGEQITLAYFKDGIEDVVLRPAFEGSVDEFGMLIPFPSAPAIRKAPDDIMNQMACAVTPPQVTIDLRYRRFKGMVASRAVKKSKSMEYEKADIAEDKVRVLKKEAVGMYQVAVLEAGSSKALERWMTEHKYVYPKGMDDAVDYYVNEKWCFVAVKAKVGDKSSAEPKPGMRDVNANRQKNSKFKGAVQAMGFRFKVEKPIIPMRLSSYNPGELHNIVYFLSDKASKINELPDSFVREQLSGEQLLKHLTQSLPAKYLVSSKTPIEVGCGEKAKLTDDAKKMWTDEQDKKRRDPSVYNGKAKEMILANLLASQKNILEHDFEKEAKELLNISESLGLRGKDVDALIAEVAKSKRESSYGSIEEQLKNMTLTVLEGDFPRMTLRNNDLTFAAYVKPGKPTKKGNIWGESLGWPAAVMFFIALALFVGRNKNRLRYLVLVMMSSVMVLNAEESKQPSNDILKLLEDQKQGEIIIEALTTGGKNAVPSLVKYATNKNTPLPGRGRALVILKHLKDDRASKGLENIYNQKNEKSILRLWAAAAWLSVNPEKALNSVLAQPNVQTMMNISQWISQQKPSQRLQTLRQYFGNNFKQSDYDMFNALNNMIIKQGQNFSMAFSEIILHGQNNTVRRSAAAFLGNPEIKSEKSLKNYLKLLQYSSAKAKPPWQGGALFVPGITWSKPMGAELSSTLIQWMLWAESNKQQQNVNQIRNNLAAVGNQLGIAGWGKVWQMKGKDWVMAWVNKFALPDGKASDDKAIISQAISLISQAIALDSKNAEVYIQKLQGLHGIK